MQESVSHQERELLISSHPLFCLLNPKEINEFASLLEEVSVETGQVIAEQGDIIDKIYLIAEGMASVIKKVNTLDKNLDISMVTLSKGDAIGLSSIGIFSQTGIRTANVIAKTPMVLLAIDLTRFYDFLQRPDVGYPALQNATEKLLLMKFIQDTHLFSDMNKEEIQQIAQDIKKIKIKKEECLFREGDYANKCYFILSGKIRISRTINNKESVLTVLEPSSLLGEAAFLEGKRQASAFGETDCELFVLEKQQLDILLDKSFSNDVSNLHIKVIRPARNNNIFCNEKKTPEGDTIFIATNENKQILRLSNMEYAILNQINGSNKIIDIFHIINKEFKNISFSNFYTVLLKLNKFNLISLNDGKENNNHLKHFLANLLLWFSFKRNKKGK